MVSGFTPLILKQTGRVMKHRFAITAVAGPFV